MFNEYFLQRYNPSTTERWSKSAIECYERGLNCEGCFYFEKYFKNAQNYKCHMKAAVMELTRKYGKPRKDEEC